jgi:hypothetical protein
VSLLWLHVVKRVLGTSESLPAKSATLKAGTHSLYPSQGCRESSSSLKKGGRTLFPSQGRGSSIETSQWEMVASWSMASDCWLVGCVRL